MISRYCHFVLLLVSGQALADLHVYEGFDYAPGPKLAGLESGAGWASAWEFQAYESPIVADSLVYRDEQGNTLNTSGGKLFNIGNSGANDSSQPGRTMGRHFGEDGTTIWVSFLGHRVGNKNGSDGLDGGPTYVRGANIALFDTTATATFPGQERLDVGENSNTPNDAWMLRAPATADPLPESATVTQISERPFDELSLVVLRFDFVANTEEAPNNDRLSMWINPPLGAEPTEDSVAAQILDVKEFAFDRLRFFAGGNNGNDAAEWYVDEIRVGDTYGDVTPFTPAVLGEPHLFVPFTTPFGALPLGAGMVSRTVKVTNFGKATDLTITSAIVTGPDAALFTAMGDFPLTLAPGASADIAVTFDPAGRDGEFAASLVFTSNDENEPERILNLAAAVPDPNQLMAWYKMDETVGDELTDASGNGRHGKYFGTHETGVAGLAGGTAVRFTNDGLAAIDRFPVMSAFTLSLWIQGDAPMDAPAGLVAKGDLAGDPYALGLNGPLLIWFGGGNTDFEGNEATTLSPATPYHLAGVFDPNNGTPQVHLYINGSLAHTITSPTFFSDSTGVLQIGAAGGSFPFQGVIDDVQIYGKVLTAMEIAELTANPGEKLGSAGGGGGEGTGPFAIEQIGLADGVLSLTFPSANGTVYELQTSSDLQSWSALSQTTAASETTTTTVARDTPSKFFRIERK